MRVSRLFIDDNITVGQQISLQEQSAHYVRTVLRLKKEQALTLFNGTGGEFLCSLGEVSRKRVAVNVLEAIDRSVESPLHITLAMAISRGDRMDWAVQKSVELGVNSITPIFTERCVVKLTEEKKLQRLQHWKNIAQHAAEQCGRTVLPEFNDIDELQHWVQQQDGLKVFLDPYAEITLSALKACNNKVTLMSGPEGGFSEPERELAVASGFIPVRLGRRILRTETASIAALSAIQMLWGDFC